MNDYKYIKAWGKMLGSKDYYINAEIQQAIKDNAPANAIFKSVNGKWHTVEDILRPNTIHELSQYLD